MSYIDDHPTRFSYLPYVRAVVTDIQRRFPWLTYICTYVWHPPYDPYNGVNRDYQRQSFDVWGGGGSGSNYTGYRGKPLPAKLGIKIFDGIMRGNFGDGPDVAWIIYRGRMWVRGEGWQRAPYGPPDSDPGHWNHIHVTFMPW